MALFLLLHGTELTNCYVHQPRDIKKSISGNYSIFAEIKRFEPKNKFPLNTQ